MTDFQHFIEQLGSVTVHRIALFGQETSAGPDRMFIGCGSWPKAGEPASAGLILNNKASHAKLLQRFTSVTKLAANLPTEFLESWPIWSRKPLSPAAALDLSTLVVEDVGPDSMFGTLIILARLAGVEPDRLPHDWIDAVDAWEREGVADDPWNSWCVLSSALTHANFPIGVGASSEAYAKSWSDGLRLAAACLGRKVLPNFVPAMPEVLEWRGAQAALHQEESVYLDWLTHASVLQLSLPLASAPGRRLLTDSLLVVEVQPTGAAKVFYRNDRARAPLREGFSFSAHCRPSERSTGNDITISVDPRRGVHLRDLWHELERLETEKWSGAGQDRPHDRVRSLEGGESLWNEPWFINPEGTLIGAPRRLANGEPGSKLTWSEVRDAIWMVFNPLRDVTIWPVHSERMVPIEQLEPEAALERSEHHGKRLLMARWPRSRPERAVVTARSLSEAPIVGRVIAALVDHGGRGDPITIDDLPKLGSWDQLPLSGGFATVTQNGLFVLEDWTQRPLNLASIKRAFEDAAILDNRLNLLERDEMKPVLLKISEALKLKSISRAAEELLRDWVRLGAELAALRARYATPPRDIDARIVYDGLDDRWALNRRLSALEAEAKSVESSLRMLGELRLLKVSRLTVIGGFAALVSAGIAEPVAKLVGERLYGIQEADPLLWLASFFGAAGVIGVAIYLWLVRDDSLQGGR